MEHPAPQDGGEVYHQDAGHKMKATYKGKLASIRPANFIPFHRRSSVGDAINVPQCTYAYYERGQSLVPPQVLCALAEYYKISVNYILGRTDKKK